MKKHSHNRGFTLVELLISVMILAGAISGVLLLFSASMASSEFAWDTTVATSHAEHILEEMQSRDSLAAILSADWKSWTAGQGMDTLPGETVGIHFADKASNPLDVQVTVNWLRKSRSNELTLKTKIAK
jgi:prepilin-type N-terminal cleavage/methylation domain-containing protein